MRLIARMRMVKPYIANEPAIDSDAEFTPMLMNTSIFMLWIAQHI